MQIIILLMLLVAVGAYSGVKQKGDNPLWRQREVNRMMGGSYVSSDEPANQYVSFVNRQAIQRTTAPVQQNVRAGAGDYVAPEQQTSRKMTPEQRQKLEAYRQKKARQEQNTYSKLVSEPVENMAAQTKDRAETMKKDVNSSQILNDIQDLMVKGYDGNMNFDRDFLGEAVDMINSFMM